MADNYKNLAVSKVVSPPSPATTGTSLGVATGQGTRFPAAPFNAFCFPDNAQATPDNCEIVRVVAKTTDTFTVIRAQEGTTAQSIATGYQIYAGVSLKTLTDIQAALDLKSDLGHVHDDRYYTKPQVDAKIGGISSLEFSIFTYGAVADGVTDDTAAIQAALDAASAAGGGVVRLGRSISKITNTLVPHTGTTIAGYGMEISGIHQATVDKDAIYASGISSLGLEDLGIYGNGTGSTPGSGTGIGVHLDYGGAGNNPFHHFRNVMVRNFGSHGVKVQTAIVSDFTNVYSAYNGGDGFIFWEGGTSCAFVGCWARQNSQSGYHFDSSVYISLSGCASDNNGINYEIVNAQSIKFSACGSEGALVNNATYNGYGWKITNSSVIDIMGWIADNRNIGVWVTGAAQGVAIRVADNTPNATAVNFIKVDSGCIVSIYELHNTTANSLATGTTNIYNDGGNGTVTKTLELSDTSGNLFLTAAPDGGDFNIFHGSGTKTLALYGSGASVLNMELLDGYLQLDTLTATTVPYLDANKRFVSSAVTPTELGYVSGVTSSIQAQLTALAGGTFQPLDSDLTTIAGLTATTDNFMVSVASAWASRTPSQVRTTLGLVIGTNVQAWDTDLDTWATKTAPAGTVVGTTDAQTLTNKTLTTPIISSISNTGTLTLPTTSDTLMGRATTDTITGTKNFTNGKLILFGSTSGTLALNAAAIAGTSVWTIPAATDTVVGKATTDTLTNKTFDTAGTGNSFAINGVAASANSGTGAVVRATSPALTTPTGIVKGDVGLGNVDNTSDVTKNAATVTLTNKRITKRIGTTASSATPTPDGDNNDVFTVTAQAAAAAFAAPSGTPTDGQQLIIRVKDNGTARALTWNAIYRFSSDLAAPSTTIISKTYYLGFVYNAADSKWDNVSQLQNF